MAKKSLEPFLWTLFSAGGVLAALFLPIHLLLFGTAIPLGLLADPGHDALLGLLRNPLTRIYLFFLCMLALFHGGHRLRFTLYDGLQIKHLNEVIAVLCYGGAIVGSVWAGYLLWHVS
jgi:fumarate reductase subunit D